MRILAISDDWTHLIDRHGKQHVVQRGCMYPPGVAAPEPRREQAIQNLFAFLDSEEMERLWDGVHSGADSMASKARRFLYEVHGYSCECAAYAASMLASNDVGFGDL